MENGQRKLTRTPGYINHSNELAMLANYKPPLVLFALCMTQDYSHDRGRD